MELMSEIQKNIDTKTLRQEASWILWSTEHF
jgi:hypothetical protein